METKTPPFNFIKDKIMTRTNIYKTLFAFTITIAIFIALSAQKTLAQLEISKTSPIEVKYKNEIAGVKYFLPDDLNKGIGFDKFSKWLDENTNPVILKLDGGKSLIPVGNGQYRESLLVNSSQFDDDCKIIEEIALKNNITVEIRKQTGGEKCAGETSKFYNFKSSDITLKTSDTKYNVGEEVKYSISNETYHKLSFYAVSVQLWKEGQWNDIVVDAPCVCQFCHSDAYISSKTTYKNQWFNNWVTCEHTAPPGLYRLYIPHLSGDDGYGCSDFVTTLSSNEFEIVEKEKNDSSSNE